MLSTFQFKKNELKKKKKVDLIEAGVRVRVRVRVGVVIKPITLSRYPLARKGILFGGPAMEKSLDTRRR